MTNHNGIIPFKGTLCNMTFPDKRYQLKKVCKNSRA